MLDGTTCVVDGAQIDCGEGWKRIDEKLRSIAKRRVALDREEAEWLVRAEKARIHTHFDYGSFLEYMERVLGYTPKTAIDRLRVARALHDHAALRASELPFSALRELARVVTANNVEAWVSTCQGKSVHEIEASVSGRRRGDQPTDSPRGPQPQVRRLELAPETLALLCEVQRDVADELGHAVDDDTLINRLCRAFLGSSAKKPAYSIAMTVCESCRRARQDGGGVTVEVSPAVRDAALCDAAHVGKLDTPTPPTIDIPAATRALVRRRDHGRCAVPGCRAKRNLELHHIKHREHGGTHDPENIVLLCSGHHAAHHRGTLSITGTGSHPRITRLTDPTPPPEKTVADDVRSALVHMGYKPHEARLGTELALAHVGPNPSLDQLIRAALKTFPKPH